MSASRIVIVGGVAGGASAAARARRMDESAQIIMFEKSDYVSFANCGLPYYIGGKIEDRSKLLVATPQAFKEKFNIEVHTGHEVLKIDRKAREVVVFNHKTGREFTQPYDRLVLAPGATPILPSWDGANAANLFTLRDVPDSDRIKAWVDDQKPKRAVVVGAGFIGLEMVEALIDRQVDVSLVELQPHILPLMDDEMAERIETVLTDHQVDLHLNVSVEGLQVDADRVSAVCLSNGKTVPADMVLVSIGVRPNIQLAVDAGLEIGASGGIAVNENLQTNDEAIYAVGDAAEVVHLVTGTQMRIPLAGPANRNGRLAGQHAATNAAPAATPVLGTSIVGAFGQAAAMTGLSVKAARSAGMPCQAVYAIGGHHAGYYPGAEQMILKLVYDPNNRRILGAQAVGGQGVDKRIDVIATAMRFAGTIDDLAGVDLTYAPQFGSSKDPVHIAAFIAQNQTDGLVHQILPGEPVTDSQVVDVRTPKEFAGGSLSSAVNIPLQQLRQRLDEFDRHRPVTVLCGIGQRGYVACRVLMQNGFKDVRNLAGGYTMHKNSWSKSLWASAS